MKAKIVRGCDIIARELNQAGDVLIQGDSIEYDGLMLNVYRVRKDIYRSREITFAAVDIVGKVMSIEGNGPVNEWGKRAEVDGLWQILVPVDMAVRVYRADDI